MATILAMLFLKPSPQPVKPEHNHSDVPLPECCHKILTKAEIGHNHICVIGDVHGCLDELKTLVSNANHKAKDHCIFIFVGDLINKGPKNKETLDYIRSMGDKVYAVRGNHDEHVIRNWMHLMDSSKKEVKPKYSWIKDLTTFDIDFLLSMPYTITIPHLNSIVVHAGFDPYQGLESQTPEVMTKIRNVVGADNMDDMYPTAEANEGIPWASLWTGPQHVYFGHDAQRGYQDHPYATGLDTGCVYGKQLTGKFLTGTKKVICVQARRCYADTKDEKTKLLEGYCKKVLLDYEPENMSVTGIKTCICKEENCHHVKFIRPESSMITTN